MGKNNCVWNTLKCVIRYYIWCLDACVKFISENAYVQVAITGESFCTGAKESFFLILRNPGLMAAMNVAGWMMSGIGKALIMGLCTWLTMILAENNVLTGEARIQ
jgi:choline transporter-like protein 2/4/5